MKKYIFKNGLKLVYEYKPGDITSFTIGFNAGALEEDGFPLGTAHALEHMLFKGTEKRTEADINAECDRIFGFNNAMTNYPYAIYYGTLMSEEFESGIQLYTDIVLNPILGEEGFKEEMSVINEELKEWKEDPYQFCEDELFYNSFKKRRIKYPIIGTEDSIKGISIDNLKEFYRKYYIPSNCVISVVSSLDFEKVLYVINQYYGEWQALKAKLNHVCYEDNLEGLYIKQCPINGAKIYYCFPIHNYNEDEILNIMIINNILGCGTSSILYDAVRTRQGLAYDISSIIKNERGIKLLEIYVGTSCSNTSKTVNIINRCLKEIEKNDRLIKAESVENAIRSVRLRRRVALERSVELSKALTVYELMYGSSENVYREIDNLNYTNKDKIIETAKKVLKRPSIQIIK